MRRYLCFVLAIALAVCLSACGSEEQAVEIPGSKGLEFESNGDGTCTVVGIGSCTDTVIVIPAQSPKGDKVVSIAEWAFSKVDTITGLTVEGMELEIEDYAFYKCDELMTVRLENSTLEFGTSSFSETGLKELYIVDSTVDTSFNVFFNSRDLTKIEIDGSTVDFESDFSESSIECLKITDSEVKICGYCFFMCEDLSEVIMENSTVTLEDGAFSDAGAEGGTFVAKNSNLEIGEYAMSESAFETFTASGYELALAEGAFFSSEKLQSIELDYECVVLKDEAIGYCDDLESVTITAEVLELGDQAIASCDALTSIIINCDDIVYGEDVFYGNDGNPEILVNGNPVNEKGEEQKNAIYDIYKLTLVLPDSMLPFEVDNKDAAYIGTYDDKELGVVVEVEEFTDFTSLGYDVTTMTREEYGQWIMDINNFEHTEIQNVNGVVSTITSVNGFPYYYSFWKDSDAFYTVGFFSFEQEFEELLPVMKHYTSLISVGGGL